MKTFKNILFAAAMILALSLTLGARAYAQDAFVVATGNGTIDKKTGLPGSTYVRMFRDLSKVCTGLPLTEKQSNGSVDNLELLTNKDADGAIVQGDLLAYIDQTDPAKVSNVKTVFTLAPEELHFVARADVKKEGGYGIAGFKVGGSNVEFRTLADLQGRKVGAVGGSILSGRVVAKQSGLGFQMVDAGNNEKLIAGLLDGTYDAVLIVAGSPSALVSGLDTRFRLLPVSQETAEKLKAYKGTKLSYSNLNQAGVPTVATQALFVSRSFRDPAVLNNLAKLRACVASNVYKLQDAKGTHPKWQAVDPADQGRWAWYELPAAK